MAPVFSLSSHACAQVRSVSVGYNKYISFVRHFDFLVRWGGKGAVHGAVLAKF